MSADTTPVTGQTAMKQVRNSQRTCDYGRRDVNKNKQDGGLAVRGSSSTIAIYIILSKINAIIRRHFCSHLKTVTTEFSSTGNGFTVTKAPKIGYTFVGPLMVEFFRECRIAKIPFWLSVVISLEPGFEAPDVV